MSSTRKLDASSPGHPSKLQIPWWRERAAPSWPVVPVCFGPGPKLLAAPALPNLCSHGPNPESLDVLIGQVWVQAPPRLARCSSRLLSDFSQFVNLPTLAQHEDGSSTSETGPWASLCWVRYAYCALLVHTTPWLPTPEERWPSLLFPIVEPFGREPDTCTSWQGTLNLHADGKGGKVIRKSQKPRILAPQSDEHASPGRFF
jgi:hypothetical protein